MKKNLSKSEAEKKIEDFFEGNSFSKKSQRETRKIKNLAMSHNILLKAKRKLFCKKCFSPYSQKKTKIRIKNNIKSVKCGNCGKISRWRIK